MDLEALPSASLRLIEDVMHKPSESKFWDTEMVVQLKVLAAKPRHLEFNPRDLHVGCTKRLPQVVL